MTRYLSESGMIHPLHNGIIPVSPYSRIPVSPYSRIPVSPYPRIPVLDIVHQHTAWPEGSAPPPQVRQCAGERYLIIFAIALYALAGEIVLVPITSLKNVINFRPVETAIFESSRMSRRNILITFVHYSVKRSQAAAANG